MGNVGNAFTWEMEIEGGNRGVRPESLCRAKASPSSSCMYVYRFYFFNADLTSIKRQVVEFGSQLTFD